MRDIMAIAAELGVELHPERIALIAEKLERINSAEHFALVKPLFGPAVDKGLVNKLDKAWQGKKEMTPRELAAALRGASAAAIENANRGTTELVWTGPSTGLIPIRHTEQVLCEVINHARRKLFIRLVQEPGWFLNKSCEKRRFSLFFSGSCSITSVIEQLYCKFRGL